MLVMNITLLSIAQYLLLAATVLCIFSMGTVYNGLTILSLSLLAAVVYLERVKSLRTGRPMFR